MTRSEFIRLAGEDPEDVFGPDWRNELECMDEIGYDIEPNKSANKSWEER